MCNACATARRALGVPRQPRLIIILATAVVAIVIEHAMDFVAEENSVDGLIYGLPIALDPSGARACTPGLSPFSTERPRRLLYAPGISDSDAVTEETCAVKWGQPMAE